MTARSETRQLTRRRLLRSAAAGLAALTPAAGATAQAAPAAGDTVRDRFWVFACAANSDYVTIRRRSVMTPVESAVYLDVPNLLVVQSSESEARYGRFDSPFAQYTIAMRPLRRVVWSVVGSGGFTAPAETNEVLELAKTVPNFAGLMLDDFFHAPSGGKPAVLSLDELADIRRRLKAINPKLRIFVTLYVHQFAFPLYDYLKLIDVITVWTGSSAQLVNLESNWKRLEQLAPHTKKMLGCYFIDYGSKTGVPVDAMRLQCETGLRWLKQGRIEGMIFLGNTVMDLGFESVQWTREWIRKVGDTKL
jgi:hypothetical protein